MLAGRGTSSVLLCEVLGTSETGADSIRRDEDDSETEPGDRVTTLEDRPLSGLGFNDGRGGEIGRLLHRKRLVRTNRHHAEFGRSRIQPHSQQQQDPACLCQSLLDGDGECK